MRPGNCPFLDTSLCYAFEMLKRFSIFFVALLYPVSLVTISLLEIGQYLESSTVFWSVNQGSEFESVGGIFVLTITNILVPTFTYFMIAWRAPSVRIGAATAALVLCGAVIGFVLGSIISHAMLDIGGQDAFVVACMIASFSGLAVAILVLHFWSGQGHPKSFRARKTA